MIKEQIQNGVAISIGFLVVLVGVNIVLVAIGIMPKHQAAATLGIIAGSALITGVLGLTVYHKGATK